MLFSERNPFPTPHCALKRAEHFKSFQLRKEPKAERGAEAKPPRTRALPDSPGQLSEEEGGSPARCALCRPSGASVAAAVVVASTSTETGATFKAAAEAPGVRLFLVGGL